MIFSIHGNYYSRKKTNKSDIFFLSQILSFVEKCKYPIFQIRVKKMATAKPLPAKLVGKRFERFFWNVIDRFNHK